MKGSDLLVLALENEGVERIFGVPGEENLDVVESLRRSRIQLVLTRHEQSAAFMAATHGRLTGRAGVCISTLGPGALNLVTGAAYAHLGAMPMVMITGQKAIMTSRQARFQIVDIVATDQVVAPDHQRREYSHAGPRRIPRGSRGAARSGTLGVAGGRFGSGGKRSATAGAAAPDRPARGPPGCPRPSGSDDPRCRTAPHYARGCREPATPLNGPLGFRAPYAYPVLQYPNGQGLSGRRLEPLHGHGGPLREGLRASGHRPS